jgi:hypothetical protein
MRLFHATAIENVQSIKEKGLLPKFGEVYLADSVESACRWMGFRFAAQGIDTFAVIEAEVDKTKLVEGTDHSPMMVQLFGVGRSLVSEKRIPKSRIKKIHYFKIPTQ